MAREKAEQEARFQAIRERQKKEELERQRRVQVILIFKVHYLKKK